MPTRICAVLQPSDAPRSAAGRLRGLEDRRVHRRLLAAVAAALVAAPLAAARVEIVLDASGSMRGAAGGTSKMEAAREAVRTTVEALDAGSIVALRLYGHRLPSEPKEASCADIELAIPFGPLDRESFIAAVESAQPLGQTPLAHSLEQAAADFGEIGDEPAAVILVSDGEESCGGDPAAVACAFAERGLDLTIHTVGFDVDAAARAQLQAVARCTGGEYRDATNAGELAESLRQLTQAGLLVDKGREVVGEAIRGGDGFGSAVPIAPGTYRLDHHQRPNEYDYFAIEVAPGHLLRVRQEATEVGVSIDGVTFSENTSPVVGAAIHGPDRERISENSAINAGNSVLVEASVSAGNGGAYYVLVGQDVWSTLGIHLDSPFTVEIVDRTDAGSGTDAGGGEAEALPIEPGEHTGWLQVRGESDVYVLQADSAATYSLRARPEASGVYLVVAVTDEDGVQLARDQSPNPGAAVRLEAIAPERDGPLFVTLEEIGGPTAYALQLTAEGGAQAPVDEAETPADDAESAAGETAAVAPAEGDGEGAGLSAVPGGAYTVVALVAFLLGLVVGVVVTRRLGRARG